MTPDDVAELVRQYGRMAEETRQWSAAIDSPPVVARIALQRDAILREQQRLIRLLVDPEQGDQWVTKAP